ncbi:MAG: hypothetical protein IH852_01600 [Bacteroidetes bacterium]|nr:hypothetical protein [Bacteroidota bacterium]
MIIAIIVFTIFCLLLFFIGFTSKDHADKSELNYFLGNRKLKSIQIGLSAGATGNTGFIMTGAVGLGYAFGIDWLFLPFAWLIGDLIFWKYFPHKLNEVSHKENIISPVSFISNNRIITIILSLIVIISLGAYASSQFIASSKSLTGYFALEQKWGILLTGFVIIGYLLFGGFRASVRTDIVQAIMMIVITSIVLVDVCIRYDLFDNYGMFTSASKVGFSIPFFGWSLFTLIGFFLGWSSAAIGFGLGQPQIISRYFAGQSIKQVKNAKWIYIIFLQFTWFGMTLFGYLIGLSGFVSNDPESALAEYSLINFTPLLSGIILAGIFSSIASTIDSMCLSISTSITKDIFKRESNQVIRYLILLLVVLALILISLSIETHSSTVFVLAKLSISLMASSLGLAILLKLTTKNISDKALFIGVISSFITCILWYSIGYSNFIVESLPALIIGLIISHTLNRLKY